MANSQKALAISKAILNGQYKNKVYTSVQRTDLNNNYMEKLLSMPSKKVETVNREIETCTSFHNLVNAENTDIYNLIFNDNAITIESNKTKKTIKSRNTYEMKPYESLEHFLSASPTIIAKGIIKSYLKPIITKKGKENSRYFDLAMEIISKGYNHQLFDDITQEIALTLTACHNGYDVKELRKSHKKLEEIPQTMDKDDFKYIYLDTDGFLHYDYICNKNTLWACYHATERLFYREKVDNKKALAMDCFTSNENGDSLEYKLSIINPTYNRVVYELTDETAKEFVDIIKLFIMGKLKENGEKPKKILECCKVFEYLKQGYLIKEIAEIMGISRQTIAKDRDLMFAAIDKDTAKKAFPKTKTFDIKCFHIPEKTHKAYTSNKTAWFKNSYINATDNTIAVTNRQYPKQSETTKKALRNKAFIHSQFKSATERNIYHIETSF